MYDRHKKLNNLHTVIDDKSWLETLAVSNDGEIITHNSQKELNIVSGSTNDLFSDSCRNR